ncbi:MAG TPA: Fur family transcriptional regulator [Candidatus Saccharimonadales bacterium]|nr:Fur family transcriptional regulator [Candidatus Saccharimonadales bacterium]
MGSAQETFTSILKAHRQSITKTRLRVFGALVGQEPLSMHALVARLPDVDRASVYRAVDLFERLGIIQHLNMGWKYKLELTDKFADHHHHLTCVKCGATIAMNENELEQVIERLAAVHSFAPSAHQIEIQGLCSQCQQAA